MDKEEIESDKKIARRYLCAHAHGACTAGLSIDEWEDLVALDDTARKYIELLGGPKILTHISSWVFRYRKASFLGRGFK